MQEKYKKILNGVYCVGAHRHKFLFTTEKKAMTFIRFNSPVIAAQNEEGKTPVRAYFCQACGGWHVTSEKGSADYEKKKMLEDAKARQKKERAEYLGEKRRQETAKHDLMLDTLLEDVSSRIGSLRSMISAGDEASSMLLTDLFDELDYACENFDGKKEMKTSLREELLSLESEMLRLPAFNRPPEPEEKKLEDEFGYDSALVWDNWVGVSKNGKVVSINEIRATLENGGLDEEIWGILKDADKVKALNQFGWKFSDDNEEAEDDIDREELSRMYDESFKTFRDTSPQRAAADSKAVQTPSVKTPERQIPAAEAAPSRCLEWGRWSVPGLGPIDIDTMRARLEMEGYDEDVWEVFDDAERLSLLRRFSKS